MRCIIMREGWYLYYHYLLISILFFPFYEYVGRDFLPCNESIVDEPLLEYWIQNAITLNDKKTPVKILTSCPSCLQGLARYGDDTNTSADYIVVELAKNNLGEHWMEEYVEKVTNGGIEKILL